LAVEKVKPDPLNLTANTVVGSVVEVFKALACRASAFFTLIQGFLTNVKQKSNIGGGTALAVEKVKPDPLNLTVNTVVGKRPCML
jgi:hypothetical protein